MHQQAFRDALAPAGLLIDHIELAGDQIRITGRSGVSSSICPRCGRRSTRIHSHYRNLQLGGGDMTEQVKTSGDAKSVGRTLWQTACAMIVAVVAWLVVAVVVGFLLSLWNKLTTITRPEIIDFFSAVIAAAVGMAAARAACDKVFDSYARRAIFVLFAGLSILMVVVELALLAEPNAPITVTAQGIVIIIAAYVLFWQRE